MPAVVIVSGDVLPEPGAVTQVVRALQAPGVGMSGGRPMPVAHGGRPITEIIPAVQFPANARFAMPMVLALATWVFFIFIGIKRQGPFVIQDCPAKIVAAKVGVA